MKNFKDVYKFPFKHSEWGGNWYYDANDNFIFQLEVRQSDSSKEKLTMILNKEMKADIPFVAEVDNGNIYLVDKDGFKMHFITIRGWGNLTGSGGMRLSDNDAANIQNTLADYIVETLNNR